MVVVDDAILQSQAVHNHVSEAAGQDGGAAERVTLIAPLRNPQPREGHGCAPGGIDINIKNAIDAVGLLDERIGRPGATDEDSIGAVGSDGQFPEREVKGATWGDNRRRSGLGAGGFNSRTQRDIPAAVIGGSCGAKSVGIARGVDGEWPRGLR